VLLAQIRSARSAFGPTQEPQRRRCLARFLLQLLEDLLRRQPLTLGLACIHFKTGAWN